MFTRLAQPPRSLDEFMIGNDRQFLPVSMIAFGPNQVVLPTELPPSSMVFSNPTFNKMLNIPGQTAQSIYSLARTGRMSA